MIKKIVPISSIVLLTLLFIYCTTDESTIIGPFGNAGKYITVLDFSADKEKVYSKGDTSIVSLKVLNIDKTPVIGLIVKFSAQFGNITKSDTTDSSGVAIATFVSDDNTGENIITADTGVKTETLLIAVVKYQPAVIELSSESPILLADGISSTIITAVLKDSVANPMPGMVVIFTKSLGKLSSELVLTDDNGIATTVLTSSDTIGTAIITAESGIENSIDIKFHMDVPELIELSAEYPVLLAGGSSRTKLWATLTDETGARMAYQPVSFKTNLGEIEGKLSQTGADGIATAELVSSIAPGTARIIATSFISDTTYVEFNNNTPASMDLYPADNQIVADGVSVTTITAIPKDSNLAPMAGIPVEFSTTLGTLKPTSQITDIDGIAEVELVSSTEIGEAEITATSSIKSKTYVTFISYNPTYIQLETDIDGNTVLADGISEINITAMVYNSANQVIPWALVDFSTTHGTLLNNTTVRANQDGKATIVLRSSGSNTGVDAIVSAEVQDDSSISQTILIRFRGISIKTHIDSLKFATGGYYKVYIRAELIDNDEKVVLEKAMVAFSSTIGSMEDEVKITNEFGRAFSVLSAEVTGADQSGLIITSELFHASVVKDTAERRVPGVEMFINTVDGEVMGDGEGWALVKATLRETTGEAIGNVEIDWETEVGTIIGRSKTNTSGHTIDTLRIEYAVSDDINVGIIAKYGNNISDIDILTFISPVNDNRLIMGFEPDTVGRDTIPIPCDIPDHFAIRDAGISALYVDALGNPIGGQIINFSVVPNNFAAICASDTTVGDLNGLVRVMLAHPPKNISEVVRVWAEAPDGTRGSIDVILPKVEEEEEDDSGGG